MVRIQARRLLLYTADLVPAGGLQVCSTVAGPFPHYGKEAAGISFHEAILRQQGLLDDPKQEEEVVTEEAEQKQNGTTPQDADDQPPPGVSWKGSKKKKKNVKKKDDSDLYGLLGLQHERWMATEAQIKQAYRKVSLQYHPDKALVGVTDEIEKMRIEDKFKMIQDAYETLSNATKRREYDSLDEFDDSLPSDCSIADFFKVFGPAFRRNSRWSVDPKVPDVGDEKSAWEDVNNFYDFWFTFKSWREFPHPDEEDVEGAESREHRRWIERINNKLREKGKKEETKRLREFVENAYRLDPRVIKQKEFERQERERKKNEKHEAKRKLEAEEAGRKAEEEEQKQKAAEEAKKLAEEAKKQREVAKKAMKKERQKLRAICAASDGLPRLRTEDDVDELCAKLELATLSELNQSLCAFGIPREAQADLVEEALWKLRGVAVAEAKLKEEQKRQAEANLRSMAQREHEMKLAAMREWTDEELRMLDKAVAKFPQGTPKRWEQVTTYIRTRTMDEVLLMVKERKGASMQRLKAQEDWKGAQKKQAEVKSAADLRMHSFSDVEVNLVGDAVKVAEEGLAAVATSKEVSTTESSGSKAAAPAPAATKDASQTESSRKKPAAPAASPAAPVASKEASSTECSGKKPEAAAVPAAASKDASSTKSSGKKTAAAPAASKNAGNAESTGKKAGGAAVVGADAGSTEASSNKAAAAPAANGKAEVKPDADGAVKENGPGKVEAAAAEWSEEQELALVKALKQFGKELPDRWEKVSGVVPGKTKAQCMRRFKELREAFKKK